MKPSGFHLALALNLLLLPACNKQTSTEIALSQPPVFRKGAPSPIAVQMTEAGQPATGYEVKVNLSMSRMDHGTTLAVLKESAPGTYTGEVPLPMGGDWDIDVTATKNGKTVVKALTAKVNDGG